MSINSKMNAGIHGIYKKYGKDMMEAHRQLLMLEKRYKLRTGNDNKIISEKIYKIIDEVINDN
ncbi:MAG: hypothetical protein ACRCX8_04175 [Sarcina sp.]